MKITGRGHHAISLFGKRAAAEQGGLLSGKDPTEFNSADPLRLWIIQIGIIICMTQILALGLRKIRQPKVIAEVLGGILLGPTAFGRIPGFTKHIFPQESRPFLSLTANIGLCLFLFLIGLEIDASVIKRNAKLSATVALAGMSIPFGLGFALAVPLHKEFISDAVKYTYFALFAGVAFSITAFPVLCRILSELKLLDTTVGIVVLSAGVGNDIIGWVLLALAIGLVNGGGGLTALYILLTCVGWTLFVLFPLKRIMHWLARRTGSTESGPSVFFMTAVILTLFGSAFFTDAIGVHAIFGAFLAGLIVPREGNLAISLTEKLEDMVAVIFLPLYFTLSGLSTDLGLLDNGKTWGYTIAICVLAYVGKFGGCSLASKYIGFTWRESAAIGSLMSCKGLIEIIVLNVGLQAGILSPRVFSMFVLEALLLTFCTTPATIVLYPPEFRTRAVAAGANFANVGREADAERPSQTSDREDEDGWKRKFTMVLDKTEHLPGLMAMTQLIRSPFTTSAESKAPLRVKIDALRLLQLDDRTFSGHMKSLAENLLHTDPLLGIFRTFSELNDLPITTSLSVVPYDDLAGSVAEHARESNSDLIFLPWLPPTSPVASEASDNTPQAALNAFEYLWRSNEAGVHPSSAVHSHFVRSVFSHAPCDVALFVDRGHAPGESRTASSRHHLFLPFFGGPDDRLALDFVIQLCADEKVDATIVRMRKSDDGPHAHIEKPAAAHIENDGGLAMTIHSTMGYPDTVYGRANTQAQLLSETADGIAWARYVDPPTEPRSAKLASALSRVRFLEIASPRPLNAIMARMADDLEIMISKHTRMLVVAGRSRRLAVESHGVELKGLMEEHGTTAAGHEVRKTLGDVATAFVATRSHVGMIVVQAATSS